MICVYQGEKEIGTIQGEEIETEDVTLDSLFYQLADEGVPMATRPGVTEYQEMNAERLKAYLATQGYTVRSKSSKAQDCAALPLSKPMLPISRRMKFQGLDIAVENDIGSIRSGFDFDGKEWHVSMTHPYGYIERSLGVDGDHVDCFVGLNEFAPDAYVIHALRKDTAEYDEDKVMLGFDNPDEAKRAFLENYSDPSFFGSLETIPMSRLYDKLRRLQGRKIGAMDARD